MRKGKPSLDFAYETSASVLAFQCNAAWDAAAFTVLHVA